MAYLEIVPTPLKEQIHLLRDKGYSYNKIAQTLKCSKAVISYHLNANVKASNHKRMRLDRAKRGKRVTNKKIIGGIINGLIKRHENSNSMGK